MNKLVLAFMLGTGMLLPTQKAKSNIIALQRKVDVAITGWVLFSTSQAADGTITRLEIYDSGGTQLLLLQTGTGTYACSIDVSDLSSGNYVVKVVCSNTTHTEPFML